MNFLVANKKSKWTSIEIFCFHHSFRQAGKFTSNPSALYVSVPNCLIRGLEKNMGFKQRLFFFKEKNHQVWKYRCRKHCAPVLQGADRCQSPGWLGPVFQDECVHFSFVITHTLCYFSTQLFIFALLESKDSPCWQSSPSRLCESHPLFKNRKKAYNYHYCCHLTTQDMYTGKYTLLWFFKIEHIVWMKTA